VSQFLQTSAETVRGFLSAFVPCDLKGVVATALAERQLEPALYVVNMASTGLNPGTTYDVVSVMDHAGNGAPAEIVEIVRGAIASARPMAF
jgi:hypothetical protein